ncbi:hypothetical protein FRC04_001897 [Tulasnella sp. 424]|nr:hypothetical protein FRC04_001897 [Tulasnella sp. 424]KAG8977675.1 hypothetical protein FRC05_000931 [Tulasnella sp. 425]
MLPQPRSLRLVVFVISLLSITLLLDIGGSKSYVSDRVRSNPLISAYFPPDSVSVALDGKWKEDLKSVDDFNSVFERKLEDCQSGNGSCKKNQDKVVLLAWAHFKKVLTGGMQGENVWCDAMMDAIHGLGYSMLLAKDTPHVYHLWRRHHVSVHMIIWEDEEWGARPCLHNSTCPYAPPGIDLPVPPPSSTHLNIPIWKVFNAHWWNGPKGPLGGPFTLAPGPFEHWSKHNNPGKDNFYPRKDMSQNSLHPFSERPRQAYVYAKFLKFFLEPFYILPNPQGVARDQLDDSFFADLARTDNITWLGQFKFDGMPEDSNPHQPLGITPVERMERPAFQRLVGQSKVLLGIGRPALSLTPYEALCLGVPFINPIRTWDKKDPDNKEKWGAQQEGLLYMSVGEPYVYNVKVGDRDGLARAVRNAMETPLDRFIPPHMKMSALIDRMKVLLETDWRPTAKVQMEATKFVLQD